MLTQIKNSISISHVIAVAVSFMLTLVTIAGGLYAIDDRWAKADDVRLIELRLEQKILSDRLHDVQRRIWMLEDRYKDGNMPVEVREELRKLRQEYHMIQQQLNTIYQKKYPR